MSSQTKVKLTVEEYLALERSTQDRSEYFKGEVFAMGGASERHNLIVGNVFASLHSQLRARECKVYSTEMRVKVSSTGLYTYPDIVALCGDARFDDEQRDTLVNPTLIIEVLSKSTEGYDRGEKFAQYRRIESLAEYLLVAQDRIRVEHYLRQPSDQWLMSEADKPQDTIELVSVGCVPTLTEVYAKADVTAV